MSYNMILDGGGTKTLAILFDENMNLLSTGKSGGMNTNFETMEVVRAHLTECIDTCLQGHPVDELDRFFISGPGPAQEAEKILRSRVRLNRDRESLSEGTNGVLAGLCADYGISVLAGTGSRIDFIQNGKQTFNTGGWGAFIGDEGAGPWIGQRRVTAAIAYNDGWGPETCLKDMIMKTWELEKLWGVVPRVFHGRSTRVELASLSPVVGQAARNGDNVAIRIYHEAAEILAIQCLAMFRNRNLDPTTPVVITGGAWKGAPVMFDHFQKLINEQYPEAPVHRPVFDSIMGGVIMLGLHGRHALTKEEIERLRSEYSAFLFSY